LILVVVHLFGFLFDPEDKGGRMPWRYYVRYCIAVVGIVFLLVIGRDSAVDAIRDSVVESACMQSYVIKPYII